MEFNIVMYNYFSTKIKCVARMITETFQHNLIIFVLYSHYISWENIVQSLK
jgi:hypothetical protein